MAPLNIANVVNIYSKTAFLDLTTVGQTILANPAASGKILKVTTIVVSNITTGTSSNASVSVIRGAGVWYLAYGIVVPFGASLVVVSKDTPINLEEGDYITSFATSNSVLQAILCYEEMS